MPIVIPPLAHDVPAIIRTAGHQQAGSGAAFRPTLLRPIPPQPAASVQLPDIVGPPALPVTAPTSSPTTMGPSTHGRK